ncbi:acetyl-CoA carboxylase biotin carboxyl carrier protein [Actinacidiphila sp. bgisy167]|uniref:acetyl-CoA carboxylase biotin carboxyl carrier protein n=1 Tax=Actinacidiphila sp. bgisy167 TaxID=3413797 RepID=UPI003D75984E
MTLHGDDRTARPPGAGKALNGTSPGAQTAPPALEAVCRSAAELARSMPAPPRRIRLRHGQTAVEIEWPQPPASSDGPAPAPAAPAPAAPAPAAPETAPAAPAPAAPETAPAAAAPPPAPGGSQGAAGAAQAHEAHGAQTSESHHYVCAPTVGTFYHALEPGERPCVRVGDLVRPGQSVGVLEVMKMMNIVEADVAGRVVEIVVPDGQPVEFQQPLIALQPRAVEE